MKNKNEYRREDEIEPGDLPAILALGIIAGICIYGLLRFV